MVIKRLLISHQHPVATDESINMVLQFLATPAIPNIFTVK